MMTTLTIVLIGVCILLLVLVCVVGNVLVCLAIYNDSRLRRRENIFLASLAVSDLLVAILVMTFAAVNDLLGYWVFGTRLCHVWIALDIMCSTASIFNLCAVALDRYIHIRDPFRYSTIVTKKVVVMSIVSIWLLSAVISVFSLGFHRSSVLQVSRRHPLQHICSLDLSPLYAIISSLLSFCLPCLVMVAIYCRLYFFSLRHWRSISHLTPCPGPPRDHKAAITIGVVMGIFLICWLPFFCANILDALCDTCVPTLTFKLFTWLGYSNSMFNPIIYSVLNSDFREGFKLLLMRKFSNENIKTVSSSGS